MKLRSGHFQVIVDAPCTLHAQRSALTIQRRHQHPDLHEGIEGCWIGEGTEGLQGRPTMGRPNDALFLFCVHTLTLEFIVSLRACPSRLISAPSMEGKGTTSVVHHCRHHAVLPTTALRCLTPTDGHQSTLVSLLVSPDVSRLSSTIWTSVDAHTFLSSF